MIQNIIDNTVGKDANICIILNKMTVKKYDSLDYEGLEFSPDLAGYFEPNEHGPQRKIDMVVIDDDNQFKVVKKSLSFALKKVGKTGIVVLANSLPPNRPRYVTPIKRAGNWYGEVWRVVDGLNKDKNIDFVSYSVGNGYTIVRRSPNPNTFVAGEDLGILSQYANNRKKYARLVDEMGLREWYENKVTEGTDTQTD